MKIGMPGEIPKEFPEEKPAELPEKEELEKTPDTIWKEFKEKLKELIEKLKIEENPEELPDFKEIEELKIPDDRKENEELAEFLRKYIELGEEDESVRIAEKMVERIEKELEKASEE